MTCIRQIGNVADARRRPVLCMWPVLCALLGLLSGCASQGPAEPQLETARGLAPAEADARAEIVRRAPVAYLERVAANCRALQQYTLHFTRHERRGLFRKLHGPEHIQCWFRRRPFSVRMKWLDPDVKYGESVYVEGAAENKVRFVTRWWSPPLVPPPGVNQVNLYTPVAFGEAKHPLTEFGLERLMERTLAELRAAGRDVVITYVGLEELPPGGPRVHHIRLEYPAARYTTPVQELYCHATTDLPAGTILKFASGDIDASYFYTDVDPHVRLTEHDFLLEAERATLRAEQPPPAPARL